MSFYSDRLADGTRLLRDAPMLLFKAASRGEAKFIQKVQSELNVAKFQVNCLKNARVVRIPGEQMKLFLDYPHIPEQDFMQLRAPYPYLYLDPFNTPFVLDRYDDMLDGVSRTDVDIKGVVIFQQNAPVHDHVKWLGAVEHHDLERFFHTILYIPIPDHPENTYGVSFGVDRTGKLVRPDFDKLANAGAPDFTLHERITNWTIHVVNYLTSPTVQLEERQASPELQNKRARRGKPPLPGWYEIRYTKSRIRYEASVPTGNRHSFRYDVRGHFAHYRRGRMAGRVLWIPPHQRGIANTLYKPKSYRTEPGGLPEQPTTYGENQ